MRFLDSMGAFAHDVDLCMREFSDSLTERLHLVCQFKARANAPSVVSRVPVENQIFLS